jgi:hypothetical protein
LFVHNVSPVDGSRANSARFTGTTSRSSIGEIPPFACGAVPDPAEIPLGEIEGRDVRADLRTDDLVVGNRGSAPTPFPSLTPETETRFTVARRQFDGGYGQLVPLENGLGLDRPEPLGPDPLSVRAVDRVQRLLPVPIYRVSLPYDVVEIPHVASTVFGLPVS